MKKQVPEIIKENGFDFRWDIKKVWALDIPVEDIDVGELDWILDLPFWTDGNDWYNLTAREVINNIEKYPAHKQRLMECDTSYPIDIMKNLKGKWLILDGLHRLVKLLMDGHQTVKVRKLSRDLIPQIEKYVTHEMKLQESPFNSIKEGVKTIEVRLFDEKRQTIKLGDRIIFSKLPDLHDNITVEVVGLLNYPGFKELFNDFPAKDFGGEGMSVEKLVESMNKYYSKVDEAKYGVLGIKIRLINR